MTNWDSVASVSVTVGAVVVEFDLSRIVDLATAMADVALGLSSMPAKRAVAALFRNPNLATFDLIMMSLG